MSTVLLYVPYMTSVKYLLEPWKLARWYGNMEDQHHNADGGEDGKLPWKLRYETIYHNLWPASFQATTMPQLKWCPHPDIVP